MALSCRSSLPWGFNHATRLKERLPNHALQLGQGTRFTVAFAWRWRLCGAGFYHDPPGGSPLAEGGLALRDGIFHIPPDLVVEECHRSSKASRREDLQIEEPITGR